MLHTYLIPLHIKGLYLYQERYFSDGRQQLYDFVPLGGKRREHRLGTLLYEISEKAMLDSNYLYKKSYHLVRHGSPKNLKMTNGYPIKQPAIDIICENGNLQMIGYFADGTCAGVLYEKACKLYMKNAEKEHRERTSAQLREKKVEVIPERITPVRKTYLNLKEYLLNTFNIHINRNDDVPLKHANFTLECIRSSMHLLEDTFKNCYRPQEIIINLEKDTGQDMLGEVYYPSFYTFESLLVSVTLTLRVGERLYSPEQVFIHEYTHHLWRMVGALHGEGVRYQAITQLGKDPHFATHPVFQKVPEFLENTPMYYQMKASTLPENIQYILCLEEHGARNEELYLLLKLPISVSRKALVQRLLKDYTQHYPIASEKGRAQFHNQLVHLLKKARH